MKAEITLHSSVNKKDVSYSLQFDVDGDELCYSSRIPGTDLSTPLFYPQYKLGSILLSMLNSDDIIYMSENERQFLAEKDLQILFGEEWKPSLKMFKYNMRVQCEPYKIPPNFITGDVSDCFYSSLKICVDSDGISYKFDSLLDFLKYEYAILFSNGIRICECDYCGRYYQRVKNNQKCCGDAQCKKHKNAAVRKERESATVFKAHRAADARYQNRLNKVNIENERKDYMSFWDIEYKKFCIQWQTVKNTLSETEQIEWLEKQCRE